MLRPLERLEELFQGRIKAEERTLDEEAVIRLLQGLDDSILRRGITLSQDLSKTGSMRSLNVTPQHVIDFLDAHIFVTSHYYDALHRVYRSLTGTERHIVEVGRGYFGDDAEFGLVITGVTDSAVIDYIVESPMVFTEPISDICN